ncbi:hypothetical protein SmJEL517_g01814 [Synchytrium microbalum]|uniref:Cytochrome b561 domain-containing protein n=1 Tax=Synchytrium microbalum TaxID=1806994 RepID=A0A507CDH7_9FUNG|nr:uncharacterized protein SmJEL517_g01814 [Synchytrium microbalum]TPX35974.1 hypothetical protein SmJEL517_g01814 [Synchytrium microbalum]
MKSSYYVIIALFLGIALLKVARAQVVIKADPMSMSIFKVNATHATVTLTGPTNIWLSIGVGATMSNADCVVAWANGDNSVTVSRRFSSGLAVPMNYPTQNLQLVNKTVAGTTFTVVVARPIAAMGANEVALAYGNQAYIYAFGSDKPTSNMANAAFGIHTPTARKEFMANFLDAVAAPAGGNGTSAAASVTLGGPSPLYQPLVQYHGILLFFAWCVAAPVGVTIARNMKKELGVWWFRFHALIGTTVFLSQMVGTYMAYYAHNLVSTLPHFSYANTGVHGPLGLIITLATPTQFFLGIFIDRMWSPGRQGIPWYDKTHWWIGRIISFVGIAVTEAGVNLYNKSNPIDFGWIILVYGWVVIITIHQVFAELIYPPIHHTGAIRMFPSSRMKSSYYAILGFFLAISFSWIRVTNAQAVVIKADPMTMSIFKVNTTHATVTLSGPTNIWLSIGVGATMSNADCVVAWANADNTVTVSRRFSSGLTVPMNYPTQNLQILNQTVTGATFTVVVARPIAAVVANEVALAPGNQAYIYAFGTDKPTSNKADSTFGIHTPTGRKEFMANFMDAVAAPAGGNGTAAAAAPVTLGGPSPLYQPLIQYHGILLFFAWCVAAPVGVTIARFHAMLGTTIFISQVVGVYLAYYAHNLVSTLPHFSYANTGFHGPIGGLITILTPAQFFLGIFIDRMWSPGRHGIPWYDKAHWWVGRIATFTGIGVTEAGLVLYQKSNTVDPGWTVLLYGWILIVTVLQVFAELIYPPIHHTAENHDLFEKGDKDHS